MTTRLPVTLGDLVTRSGGELRSVDPAAADLPITGISLRAADAGDGMLFAALPGTRTHGAHYAEQAATAGAVAILTDPAGYEILTAAGLTLPVLVVGTVRYHLGDLSAAIYHHPARELCVIGITGTSGKTTTSYLMEGALNAAGKTVGLIGTTGTHIAGEPVATALTTPEAPDLQALLRLMVDRGVTHVVMEVSSHAIALGRVDGMDFAAAGFLNLSQDHLDFHPSMEEYFLTKAQLLDPTQAPRAALSVICVDDVWGQRLAGMVPGALTVATTEGAPPAQLQASVAAVAPSGTMTLKLQLSGTTREVEIGIPGRYNVANLAVAAGLLHSVGIDLDVALPGCAAVRVPGRMELCDEGQDFLAVVDYAHKPGAVSAVLSALRDQVTGRVGIVFGAGGDRDTGKRAEMGLIAADQADYCVITDDNPRSEDPATIRAAILAAAVPAAETTGCVVEEIGDRRAAIRAAVRWARRGDAVVIAGKGHETGQLIAGVMHPFDDRAEVHAALRELTEQT